MIKNIIWFFIYIICLLLILPFAVSVFYGNISVKNESPLEQYVLGVLAAEMPVSYHTEALKAQAVAARTYALSYSDGQAYLSRTEMEKRFTEKDIERLEEIINSTAGEIILYEGTPIESVFHAISAGYTENSENIWAAQLPYLTSVDSSSDKNAKGYIENKIVTTSEIKQKLGDVSDIKITKRTDAGYVTEVQVDEYTISGQQMRDLFQLRSTHFDITAVSGGFLFTNRGHGHGVGMSQHGANAMAQAGHTYEDILKHYYQGTELSK